MSDTTTLPEDFIYHADCMVPWQDMVSPEEDQRVREYIRGHRETLFPRVREIIQNPDVEDFIWLVPDLAFQEVFPEKQKQREEMEHALALIAYQKRGLGDCHECVQETNDAAWNK